MVIITESKDLVNLRDDQTHCQQGRPISFFLLRNVSFKDLETIFCIFFDTIS